MEDAGSIRSYWGDEEHGARRRYYTLTDEGRILLKQQREDWEKAKYLLDRLILGENEKKTGGESHEQSV
jgi:DNA-binding PadR family transcriptional regulator